MSKYLRVCLVLLFAVGVVGAIALWQGLFTFLFAWVLNFMLMMSVLYINQTFKPRLESAYYNSKKWENDGKIYKYFGVDGFRKVLVWVGWEKLNKPSNPVKKNLDALKHLEYNTRQSEFGHLIIFFIVLPLALYIAFYSGFKQSLWLFILNVILNAYPIVVQRYNRPRLKKAINRIKSLHSADKI